MYDREVFKGASIENRRQLAQARGIHLPKITSALGKDKDFLLRLYTGSVTTLTTTDTDICPYLFELSNGITDYALMVQIAIAYKCKMSDLNMKFGFTEINIPDSEYMLHLIYKVDPANAAIRLYRRFTKGIHHSIGVLSEHDHLVLYRTNMILRRQNTIEMDSLEQALLDHLNLRAEAVRLA